MSDARKRAEELLKGITPGEWDFNSGFKFYQFWGTDGDGFRFEVGKNAGSCLVKYDNEWEANAAFIAASPSLVRDLLTENTTLEEENKMLREFISEAAPLRWASVGKASDIDEAWAWEKKAEKILLPSEEVKP